MSENFSRLKDKVFKARLIKALILGAGLGFLTTGTLMLTANYELLSIKPIFSLFIGAVSFAVVFLLTSLLLYKSDARLARELDSRYGLNEKVQTMLVYKDSNNTISKLQRQDAESSLADVRIKVFDFKVLWAYVLCFLIGACVFVSSFFLKAEETPDPPTPPVPFSITQFQISAVEQLIEYVEASQMASPYKENVMSALSNMLSEVRTVTTIEERDAILKTAVDTIYEQTDVSSSALELMNALWNCETESARLLAKALNYYDWPRADEEDKFLSEMTKLRASFVYAEIDGEELDEEKRLEETKALFSSIASNIKLSLTNASLSPEDKLYIQLLRLASAKEENQELGTRVYGFSELFNYIDKVGYTDAQRELDATCTALNGMIFEALSYHSVNTSTGEYAMTSISNIFNYDIPSFKRPQLYGFDGGQDGSGMTDGPGSGSIGNGTIYGSNDLVYDPIEGKYVEYGTILDRYYSIMFGKLQGEGYTEDEKQAMEKYFSILYGDAKEEKEDE